MDKTKVTKDLENNALILERTFSAPKAKVWQAYADKELFSQWWGPEGWQTTVKEFDFTIGGTNLYGMKCVDENQGDWFGQESWGMMKYESIDEPDSFTYKDYFADAEGTPTPNMPVMTITIELDEADGKTTVRTRCVGETAEEVEKLLAMGMVEGYSSSCNRLEQLLSQ